MELHKLHFPHRSEHHDFWDERYGESIKARKPASDQLDSSSI